MYMGVILAVPFKALVKLGAPHVYGGDPPIALTVGIVVACSPCIWG